MESPPSRSAAPAAQPSGAPPVVAVVVARDPEEWFDEALASLAAQDYPNLSVLVIDAASREPVTSRVADVLPNAFVRRLEAVSGYGAAANEVLDVVEGAAFYLLCHDDVALDPATTRLLVEEAYRSNAGIVGPKLVDWHEPRRLLQVGMGIDKAGYSAPMAERGELDQEQHDAVRDVFTIPGACTLVRADLFSALGGFDEGIDFLLDDVSLCWRAQLAGARVLVAPHARVRHVEALGARRPVDDRRKLQSRHRLRVVLTCYSRLSLLRVVPQIVILHLAEILYALLLGRLGQARDVLSAWWWNLRRLRELRAARRHVASSRRIKDRDIRRTMVGGSARFSQFVRGQIGATDDRIAGIVRSGREGARAATTGTLRIALVVWAVVFLVLLAGSRHLLTRGMPAVGEFVAFRSSPFDLFGAWTSGWRTAGLGSEAPAPTAFGLLGALGTLFLGAMGALRLLLTLGLIPLGAFLAYRLPAPTGSRRAQVAALVLYVANPLPYNALAAGRWGALAVYAAAPALIGQLGRAAGLAPFGRVGGAVGPGVRSHPLWQHVAAVGLITALVGALLPAVVALVVLVAVALAVGSVLAMTTRGTLRLLAAGGGGAVVAALLHLPWTLDFFLPGSTLGAFLGPERGAGRYTMPELLRFETGPLGSAPLGWAFLVAALLPLLIGRDWRFAWAVRCWTLAIAGWWLAWASQEGWLPVGLPAADVLLAPGAAALAFSVGLGAVAFAVDLPGYRFGWRQLAGGVSAAAVALATLPVLAASLDGAWSMPGGDHTRALTSLDEARSEAPFRVLWIADPDVLPLGGWELDEGVAYATTDHGTPTIEDLWAGSDDGPTRLLADALDLAAERQTARLGRLLAPMAVRYVVVLERAAPAPFSDEVIPVPRQLATTLAGQLDLRRIDRPAGISLYENEAYAPTRTTLPEGVDLSQGGLLTGLEMDLTGAEPALTREAAHARFEGDVEAGTLYHAAAASDRWRLSIGGQEAPRSKVLGWANAYEVAEGGSATLGYRTSPLRYAMLAVQTLVWLAAIRLVFAMRSRHTGPVVGRHSPGAAS